MKKKRWFEREIVTAVHDNDLAEFLDSMGLLQKMESGECQCVVCTTSVNLDNLSAILPKNNNIHLVCDKPQCISQIETIIGDNDGDNDN